MLQTFFAFCLRMLRAGISLLVTYQLPLLCFLGGAGVGVYLYGARKLSRLYARQREETRLHPDEPVPEIPEKLRQSALAFEIAGFIILLGVCFGMLVLGHFDKYLALLGIVS